MHLVVVCGPMAVGKMTVGIELAALTGYRLFHNHLSIDPLVEVFDWGSPSFNRLNREIRLRVVEEAVIADLPGLIFTCVWAFDDPADREFVDRLARPVRTAGGRVSFVELRADQATRLAREGTEPRISRKPAKRDVAWDSANLIKADAGHRLNSDGDFPYPEDHLSIDTTLQPPAESAAQIVARW